MVFSKWVFLVVLFVLCENIGISCVIFLLFNKVKYMIKFYFKFKDGEFLKKNFFYLVLY